MVYEDNDATTNSIRLQEFDATGNTVSSSTSVISDTTPSAPTSFSNPAVAVSSATSVLIVWQEAEVGGDTRIVGKTYDPTTDTYSAEISLINFAGDNAAPAVTVLTNGNYVIVCETTATGGDQFISYRIVNSTGANVLPATEIATTQADSQNDREPAITALTGGGFVISWTNTDLNDTEVFMTVFNAAGVSVTGEIAVSDFFIDNDNESSVVALSDGGFIVLFDNDLAGELNGRRFDAAGGIVGNEFTVATGGTGIDEIDAVLLGDGRVAISFERAIGEIGMEILDTRDAPNSPAVYSPDSHIIGTIGDDVFTADAARNFGHDGNDTKTDGGGLNSMFGGAGNDRIIVVSSIGSDAFFGGADTDTIDWSGDTSDAEAFFNLTLGTATLGASSEVMQGFENLIGTANNDIIVGTTVSNTLDGGAGNDTINGGQGVDTVFGRAGDDVILVNNINDVVIEFAGQGTNDRIIASTSYTLAAGTEIERLSAIDPAAFTPINLTGNALSQVISGNAGVNILSSGATRLSDTLRGFQGDDIYRVFNTGDVIVELAGGGTGDRVAAAVNYTLGAGVNVEFLNTTNAAGVAPLNLAGNALSQVIVGNAGANILSAGAAGFADTLNGLAGNDIYRVFNAGDIIVEGAGQGAADSVAAAVSFALAGDDNIETLATNGVAGVTAIDLRGNGLTQTVQGNNGANRLNGMAGSDTLTGNGGADVFIFSTALGPINVDTITDYNVAADRIEIDNAAFVGLAAGALGAAAFNFNLTGFAADASDRITYETDTGFLWFDRDGTGGAFVRVCFADLAGGLAMTAGEFTVV